MTVTTTHQRRERTAQRAHTTTAATDPRVRDLLDALADPKKRGWHDMLRAELDTLTSQHTAA